MCFEKEQVQSIFIYFIAFAVLDINKRLLIAQSLTLSNYYNKLQNFSLFSTYNNLFWFKWHYNQNFGYLRKIVYVTLVRFVNEG